MGEKVGYLQSDVDRFSSSRAVLIYGIVGIFAFFFLVCIGIAWGWWEWALWDGAMEWLKWAFVAVIVPYAANKMGKVGQKTVVQDVTSTDEAEVEVNA